MNRYKEYHTNFYATRIQNNEPLKVTGTSLEFYIWTFEPQMRRP